MDDFKVKTIKQWIPDESARLKQFEDMTGGEVRSAFDMDPLMFTCWMCLMHMCVQDDELAAGMQLSDEAFIRVLNTFKVQLSKAEGAEVDAIFAPGSHIILQEALKQVA